MKDKMLSRPRRDATKRLPPTAGDDLTVLTADDFKPPSRVSDEDFDEICATFKIKRDQREAVRHRLDEAVDTYAGIMQEERLRPDRQGDRDWLSRALKAIKEARAALPSRSGEASNYPLQIAGGFFAPVIDVGWVAEKFPEFERLIRDRSDAGMSRMNVSDHDQRRWACDKFVSNQTVPVLSELLAEVEILLTMGANLLPMMPGGRGGRRPLIQRGYMIATLAKCWHSLGRKPTSGPNSSFTAFCEAIFDTIGWPTEGVAATVPRALSFLRYHPERIVG